ncbi:MAG TPA: hypothetical protein VK821_17755, partial [Dehalococcoidia bacterium]|nr:hypothetical protein [Dehalococcoidia bacterium]
MAYRLKLRSAFHAIAFGRARGDLGAPRTIYTRFAARLLAGKLREGSQSAPNACLKGQCRLAGVGGAG